MKKAKKFKVIEKNAKDAPVKDIEWQGEEVGVESTTKLEQDKGTGQEIVLRFFDFAGNEEVFKNHKPTAQELFESHKNGIASLLWSDGLTPVMAIEPRILFSKDGKYYRIVVSAVPSLGNTLMESTHTLSELLRAK